MEGMSPESVSHCGYSLVLVADNSYHSPETEPCHFFRLPLELRQEIYLLATDNLITRSEVMKSQAKLRDLMVTSRQIFIEMDIVLAKRLQQMQQHWRDVDAHRHWLDAQNRGYSAPLGLDYFLSRVMLHLEWVHRETIWLENVLAFARWLFPTPLRDLRIEISGPGEEEGAGQ